MKKTIIKFLGLGLGNKYQAFVKIYDKCNNLVFQGVTCHGEIKLYLRSKEVYYLIASSGGDIISTSFYTNTNKYIFAFHRSLINSNNRGNIITFLLTDYYYKNLPIEKGEMILWQK